MNYGIIDIGSNTVRIVVYRVKGDNFECLFNEKLFIQLIDYVNNGVMREAGMKSLINALQQLKNMAMRFDLADLKCFATAPFRAVNDPALLIDVVKKLPGLMSKS